MRSPTLRFPISNKEANAMKKTNYEHPVANMLILAPDDLLCTSVGWDAANKEDVVSAKEEWFTTK